MQSPHRWIPLAAATISKVLPAPTACANSVITAVQNVLQPHFSDVPWVRFPGSYRWKQCWFRRNSRGRITIDFSLYIFVSFSRRAGSSHIQSWKPCFISSCFACAIAVSFLLRLLSFCPRHLRYSQRYGHLSGSCVSSIILYALIREVTVGAIRLYIGTVIALSLDVPFACKLRESSEPWCSTVHSVGCRETQTKTVGIFRAESKSHRALRKSHLR